MPPVKSAVVLGLAVALLCGCGASVTPPQGRGKVDDPRTKIDNHLQCMLTHRLPAQEVGEVGIQIGPLPSGPTVEFMPTDGAAEGAQISGQPQYQGAEVIGPALLYPHGGTSDELSQIENCLDQGVKG
ncbi:MAG TPA: hypothetical protein VMD09_02955 [Solirubrobacteraceae bacterium]|nr:hypothetical protein [Solirubrobacteraceae bacterium]